MDDVSIVTRAEQLYGSVGNGSPLDRERLDALCEEHRSLASVLRQVHFVCEQLDPAARTLSEEFPEIPGYSVIERLGVGGMGVVWAARHDSLDRVVALKVLHPKSTDDPADRRRFLGEARAMAQVRHHNVVPVYDVINQDGVLAIAMELVPGADLGAILRRWSADGVDHAAVLDELLGPPADPDAPAFEGPERFLIGVANQVAQALSAAHVAGLLHRDVKPSNIRIRAGDRTALLLDFGVARRLDDPGRTRGFIGTPEFAAPEQLLGEPVDERSDLYSLGLTLDTALRRVLDGDADDSLRQLSPAIPADLDLVLNMAMEPDPRDRYPNAGAMARDLAAVLHGRPITAHPRSALRRAVHWVVRDRVRLGLVGTALVTLALGGFLWLQWPRITAARAAEHRASVEASLDRGFQLLLDRHRRSDAAALFADTVRLAPEDPDAVLGHIATLAMAGEEAEARAEAERHPELIERVPEVEHLLNLDPDAMAPPPRGESPERMAAYALAVYLIASHGNDPRGFEQAADCFADLQFVMPNSRQLYFGLMAYSAARADAYPNRDPGVRARNRATLARAIAGLRQLWPDSASAHGWAAKALQKEDPAGARVAAQRAMELDPDLARSMSIIAISGRFRAGDPDGALAEIDRELAAPNCDAAQLHALRGHIHSEQNRREQAIAAYREALTVDSDNFAVQMALAELHWGGSRESLLPHLHAATRLSPRVPITWLNLGIALDRFDDPAGAVQALSRCLELDPQNAMAAMNLGKVLFTQNDPGAAEALARAGRLTDSTWAPYTLGRQLVRNGDIPGAIAALEEALRRADAGATGVKRSSIETALERLR